MTAAQDPWVFRWPESPALPPPGQPVVIGWSATGHRHDRRRESRAVLAKVIAGWSGQPDDVTTLRETSRGPVWDGEVAAHPVGISLSYCERQSWIGLVRGGAIGVDAMRPADFPELELVARLYLGRTVWMRIEQAADRALAFALAWTELEARSKCLRRPIVELTDAEDARPLLADGGARHCIVAESVVSVYVNGVGVAIPSIPTPFSRPDAPSRRACCAAPT